MLTTVLLWILRAVSVLLVVCSAVPLARVGWWWVRAWDFPRLQLMVVALAALLCWIALSLRGKWTGETVILCGLLACVVAWQGWHVARYTPLWERSLRSSERSQVSVLIANLDFRNDRHEEVTDAIRRVDPDVLLLVEIDDRWLEALGPVREGYPHRVEEIRGEGLGLGLWSRAAIDSSRVRTLVSEDRPSIEATLRIEDRAVRFFGVHPTPPGLDRREAEGRHDSRIRDAELVIVAREVASEDGLAWIVAGDFNDVAWSHTTRLFKRLSGLDDPRVGRGMFSTYHAKYPLLRYPLDHVFVTPGTGVAAIERVGLPGSDHFGMYAELDFSAFSPNPETEADREDRREAEDMVENGLEDAEQTGDRAG